MTQDERVKIEGRLTKLETEMEANATATELKEANDLEWRTGAKDERKEILDAVKLQGTELHEHITDSNKVPGYKGNGGVIVINKKWLGSAILGLLGVAATFVNFQFQIIGG